MSMGACRDPPHARGERDRRGVRQAHPGAASRTTAPVRDTQRGQTGPRVGGGGAGRTTPTIQNEHHFRHGDCVVECSEDVVIRHRKARLASAAICKKFDEI